METDVTWSGDLFTPWDSMGFGIICFRDHRWHSIEYSIEVHGILMPFDNGDLSVQRNLMELCDVWLWRLLDSMQLQKNASNVHGILIFSAFSLMFSESYFYFSVVLHSIPYNSSCLPFPGIFSCLVFLKLFYCMWRIQLNLVGVSHKCHVHWTILCYPNFSCNP